MDARIYTIFLFSLCLTSCINRERGRISVSTNWCQKGDITISCNLDLSDQDISEIQNVMGGNTLIIAITDVPESFINKNIGPNRVLFDKIVWVDFTTYKDGPVETCVVFHLKDESRWIFQADPFDF